MIDPASTSFRGEAAEFSDLDALADLAAKWPMSPAMRALMPGVFMRRQEISYLIANYEAFRLIGGVKGSVFYFGVFHGAGLMTWANFCAAFEPFNHSREIIGFDTFEGSPAPSAPDLSGEGRATEVGIFKADVQPHLEKLIALYDRNRPLGHVPKVKMVRGDVRETLGEYLKANPHTLASCVVLTMNLYEPTKAALDALLPRMPRGGVVVAHSVNEPYYPGMTKALLEAMPNAKVQTFPFAPNLSYVVKE